MTRLSLPLSRIRDHYTVVVVGSGYGGGIAASRLARAGQGVCLLERGREIRPGAYPDTIGEAVGELQVDLPDCHEGHRTALYDLRVNDDMSVFVGCGLGGTSLVNANVSARAEPRVFEDASWPRELREDREGLDRYYRLAEEMLRPRPCPDSPALAKLTALERSARGMGAPFHRMPINVTFEDGPNAVGVEQRACTRCGDCVSGCNVGAKNTVLMNYLPDAVGHGAEIFTEASVRYVTRAGSRWQVHYEALDAGREAFAAPLLRVEADVVVLAAGTLGTTEILLRSRARGLALSDQLGKRFTGNGDVLAFGYDASVPIHGIGWGARDPAGRPPVGPCITGVIDLRQEPALGDGMVIEEGSIPGALGELLPAAFALAARFDRQAAADAVARLARRERAPLEEALARVRAGAGGAAGAADGELASLLAGPYTGAVDATQTYLVMAHDGGDGALVLEDDRVRVRWPGIAERPVFRRIAEQLRRADEAIGAQDVPNPLSDPRAGSNLVTVHPLGGCCMGDDAAGGVVDHTGRVFAGPAGRAVHDGLYVADGSIVPRSLGVNPLLTISALAERVCARLAAARGWTVEYALRPVQLPAREEAIGLQFSEKMSGDFAARPGLGYEQAAEEGRRLGSTLAFVLTIATEDLEEMLRNPAHRARAFGTVEGKALSPEPLDAAGEFELFAATPGGSGGRRMNYRLALSAADGAAYRLDGFKEIHDDLGLDVWRDTTTLFTTVSRPDGQEVGRGVLHIAPADFARQLTTMRVTGGDDPARRLAALARFGSFFAGALYDVYGAVALGTGGAPLPRKKRELRAPVPVPHELAARDGQRLRLLRFPGEGLPVLLVHDLFTSSRLFTADAAPTSLVEFLAAHGYDVWSLDHRLSTLVGASADLDAVALLDIPAAVARAVDTIGRDVHVVAHGAGAVAVERALASGVAGVASVVALAGAAHLAALRLAAARLRAAAGAEGAWATLPRVAQRFLERAGAEVARASRGKVPGAGHLLARIAQGDRLARANASPEVRARLDELHGGAPAAALRHLAAMLDAGGLHDARRNPIALPPEMLGHRQTFIHGSEDQVFLPAGTRETHARLTAAGAQAVALVIVAGYGHDDLLVGSRAHADVFPKIAAHLEAAAASGPARRAGPVATA